MKLIQALLDLVLASVRDRHLSQPPALRRRLATLGFAPMVMPDRQKLHLQRRWIYR